MRIGVLGSVAAWSGGNGSGPSGADVAPAGLRLRGLLARLALDPGHTVTTESLVDDLWGEEPPDGVGNALQSLVSRLRRALGAGLVATVPGGYRLTVGADDVDAVRFARLVGAARAETDPRRGHTLLGEALALWRGPALADVRRLPFADAAASRLDEQHAAALEEHATLGLAVGATGSSLDALGELLAAQPLRESAAVALARGLHASGRQADALAVLDRTRHELAEQLGVDPGPALVGTRLDVLRGAPAEVAVALPRPVNGAALTSFVGRDADVARVRGLLGTARLVTLLGPGGAGKTRLARETVAGVGRTATPVAELAALTGPDQLAATVLTAVGEPELQLRPRDEATPDTTRRLLTAVGDRDLVVVLDNCEHLVEAAAVLTQRMLESCPRLRVLATSREPLGVPGEVLHPVESLDPAAATRLFADRAAAVAPGFTLNATTEPVVAEICRRLDGQPLPLELAAARLRTLSLTEIAERLDDRFRLLTAGARTALPRHQTLRAVVDWSWDLLAEPERVLLRRLAVFAGGATAAAIERICSGGGGPGRADVFDLLAALVDKSLVVTVPGKGDAATRYRLLETIREYATERLTEAGELDALVDAHAAWAVELAEAAEPHLRTADQLRWLAGLRLENDNLTTALHRAVRRRDALTAHRLVAAMGWSWFIRGVFEESVQWVNDVRELTGDIPPDVRARTLAFLALTRIPVGEFDKAREEIEEAVRIAEAVPTPRHPVLQLLEPVTAVFADEDDGPLTELAETSDDPWVRAFALQVGATLAENVGDIDRQRTLVRAAHELFTAIGDRFGLGMTIGSLGELEDLAGNTDAAAAAYDEAIALATELGNDDDLPQFLVQRGRLAARRGELDEARDLFSRAADLARGPFGTASAVRIALADIERRAGRLDAARRHAEVAESRFDGGLAVPQRMAHLQMTRAAIEIAAGDRDAARTALVRAVECAIAGRDGPVSAAVAECAAGFALDGGDAEQAALLLGVATTHRGTLDHGNPEVVAVLDEVRTALGPAPAEEAMERGRTLPKPDGLAAMQAYLHGEPQQ